MLNGMGIRKTVATSASTRIAPKFASGYIRTVLERAIDGYGPMKSAATSADMKLIGQDGDVEKAIRSLIRMHTGLAGAQGFVTNIGGVASIAVAIPANVVGVTLVQCHLVAGIAHLRGYDLEDPRVRNAILACMLGEDTVDDLIKLKKIPSSPMALATSPVHDPELDRRVATEVTTELFGKVAGRRAATLIGRRIPLLGGGVGAASDGSSTFQIGKYAAEQLKDRRLPEKK